MKPECSDIKEKNISHLAYYLLKKKQPQKTKIKSMNTFLVC